MKTLLTILVVLLIAGIAQAQTCPTPIPATTACIDWVDNSGNNPAVNDGETGFEVWRSVNGGPATLLTTTAANTVSLVDSTLMQGITQNVYCYEVRAVNSAGQSAFAPSTLCAAGTTKTVAALPLIIPAAPGSVKVR